MFGSSCFLIPFGSICQAITSRPRLNRPSMTLSICFKMVSIQIIPHVHVHTSHLNIPTNHQWLTSINIFTPTYKFIAFFSP
jgi:hypothetical protein